MATLPSTLRLATGLILAAWLVPFVPLLPPAIAAGGGVTLTGNSVALQTSASGADGHVDQKDFSKSDVTLPFHKTLSATDGATAKAVLNIAVTQQSGKVTKIHVSGSAADNAPNRHDDAGAGASLSLNLDVTGTVTYDMAGTLDAGGAVDPNEPTSCSDAVADLTGDGEDQFDASMPPRHGSHNCQSNQSHSVETLDGAVGPGSQSLQVDLSPFEAFGPQHHSVSLDVTLTFGKACDIVGTPGDDRLTGTAQADVICGLAGNDTINGLEGNDLIVAGAGNDVVHGNEGNDEMLGGAGDDQIRGDAGNDTINGGDGNDTINGGGGRDILAGQAGSDSIEGGAGNDDIDGGPGNDFIADSEGPNDHLDGGAGRDNICGSDQKDVIAAGPGNDDVNGSNGPDRINGGSGDDSLAGDIGSAIDSDAHPCVSNRDNSADVIVGGSGDDFITGGGGADHLSGGAGSDKLEGGSGRDTLVGGTRKDVLNGGGDNDILKACDGVHDDLIGGSGHADAAKIDVGVDHVVSGVEIVTHC